MDVVVGEVVGPDRDGLVPGVQVDEDVHLARGEVDEGAVLAHAARAAHLHAVDRDVELVRVEGSPGRAHGGEHAAPVGVVAEDRALEQVVAGDRPGDLEGVGLGRRGPHLDGDVVVGALGVGDELAGQARADLGDGRR